MKFSAEYPEVFIPSRLSSPHIRRICIVGIIKI
jgi:hypothetical protein